MPLTRRWYFRYSLRALLIGVTVVAMYLGVSMHQARSRRAAIQAIDELGGTYGVYILGPEWLRNLLGDEKYFYDASRVSFGPTNQGYDPTRPFTDAELEGIIPYINAFRRFRFLDLRSTNITDEGLKYLDRLRAFEALSLEDTRISDNGLLHVQKLHTLRELDLSGTKASPEAIAELLQALPDCKITKNR